MRRKEFNLYVRRLIFELKSAIEIAESHLPEDTERETWEVKTLKPEIKEQLTERIKARDKNSINALGRVFTGIPDGVIHQEPECKEDLNFVITQETGDHLAMIPLRKLVIEWENDLELLNNNEVDE